MDTLTEGILLAFVLYLAYALRRVVLLEHNRYLWALAHAAREAPNKVELLSNTPYRERRQ